MIGDTIFLTAWKVRLKLRMPTRRVFLLLVALSVFSEGPTAAVNGADTDNEQAAGSEQTVSSELAEGWRLMHSHNPKGGADVISIVHPADTSRSDLDLVGLMIRCQESNAEVLVVVLPALPARTRPNVVLGKPGNETEFQATIAPPGTLVLLPEQATSLMSGPWHALEDLFVRVDDGQSTIRGVIKIAGLEAAFKKLQASCAAH
jgi:hypothetical protein